MAPAASIPELVARVADQPRRISASRRVAVGIGTAPRILVAAGGYRSGSTLQYNLVGEYLERAGLGQRLGYVPPDLAADIVEEWVGKQTGIGIAKCHNVVPGFRPFHGRDEAWCELISGGGVRALTTSRRQVDVERSMCRKFGLEPATLYGSLEWRENVANTARWRELGAFEQQFDELTRRPVRALRAVTEAHRIPWHPRAAVHAAFRTRRQAVIRHQLGIPSGTWDPLTQVHWDHIDLRNRTAFDRLLGVRRLREARRAA